MNGGYFHHEYLMAENDLLDVDIFTEMLQSSIHGDVKVTSVFTLAEVTNCLAEKHYSALILDINLPDNHGLDQIKRLLETYPSLPIVILTGTDDHDIAIKCLHMGVQDYVSKNQINAELLNRIMRYAVERKQIDIELKRALGDADRKNRQLTKLALTDTLTNLPNRAYFFEVANKTMAMAARMGKAVGILYFDLNGFKQVNDKFGHNAGDQVLIEIAHRLKTRLRNSDIVARLGGDEFVVLTHMLDDAVQAYSVAKKINEIICEPMVIDGNEFMISVSIGIATYPEIQSVEKLVQCADLAMYESKATKQHFVRFYTKQLDEKYRARRVMETALEGAIHAGELHANYQPIVSQHHQKQFHVEALCRWHSRTLGLVSPNQFIPIAESSRVGDQLGSFMLAEGARFKELCQEQGIKLSRISINVFGRQFSDKRFASRLLHEMSELDMSPELLCIEITERQMIENLDSCQSQLIQLKNKGVEVALDDFGTGFSSVTHLKSLPIDTLKLDRSLTSFVDKSEDNQALCDGIIHMAHRLKMKVVGEGIERVQEYQTLEEMACDDFQGYLFGHPSSGTEVLQHWRNFDLPTLLQNQTSL